MNKNTEKGYSLIEVIIALSIITIIITGYFGLSFTLSKIQNKTEIELKALIIGQNEMERLYANSDSLSTNTERTQYTEDGRKYTIDKKVKRLDTTESSSKYSVEVEVLSEDINPVKLVTVIYSFDI